MVWAESGPVCTSLAGSNPYRHIFAEKCYTIMSQRISDYLNSSAIAISRGAGFSTKNAETVCRLLPVLPDRLSGFGEGTPGQGRDTEERGNRERKGE